ncbi:MAG: DUF1294 domain-containing protein [Firmicutes bacterium]|nr:DUF1294 domain-containing protein [Bacillota bacterium]
MEFLIPYLITVNALGLLLMLADKQKARKKRWRIPEATLMGVAAIGGSAGVFLGMYLFRHKTRHPKFTVGVPLLLILHCVLLFLILRQS